jgi:hypothetical protein
LGDFNNFLSTLKNNLVDLSGGSFKKYSKQLLHDGIEFAKKLEPDLKTWETEYSIFEMTKEEFEELVKSKKDLLEMEELRKLNLPRTELNKIRNAIVEAVMETAVKVLL